MTDETTTEEVPELVISFVGTRKKGKGRQLAYQVNEDVFFVDVDSKSFLAGERIVRKAQAAVELREQAIKQGLIEVE